MGFDLGRDGRQGGWRLAALAGALLATATAARAGVPYRVRPEEVAAAFEHGTNPTPSDLLGKWNFAVFADYSRTWTRVDDEDDCKGIDSAEFLTVNDVLDPRRSVLVARYGAVREEVRFQGERAVVAGNECRLAGGGATLVCQGQICGSATAVVFVRSLGRAGEMTVPRGPFERGFRHE